jgi:hypothetical protein
MEKSMPNQVQHMDFSDTTLEPVKFPDPETNLFIGTLSIYKDKSNGDLYAYQYGPQIDSARCYRLVKKQ